MFPFADLDATERPSRNAIYGDDVIPTSALVVGRHPTLVAPQAIYSDGNHALLVKDVNGATGGSGMVNNATKYSVDTDVWSGYLTFPSSGNPKRIALNLTPRYVLGYSLAVAISDANNTGWFNLQWSLLSGDLSNKLLLATTTQYFHNATVAPQAVNETVTLPYPIDLVTTFPTYDGNLFIQIEGNGAVIDGVANMLLVMSNG